MISFIRKNHYSPFDRLSNSERQLTEFRKLPNQQKIKSFTTLFQPAIRRIYSVVTTAGIQDDYPNMHYLHDDYTLTDVGILSYCNKDGTTTPETLRKALLLKDPEEDYTLIDRNFGICEKDGEEFFSEKLAIESYLDFLAERWLEEIPKLRVIMQRKKEENS